MTKTPIYPVISCLVALVLLLSACAPGNNRGTVWDSRQVSVENAGAAATSTDMKANSLASFANLPPVRVAILLPLSGNSSAIGQSMLQAAQLALFDMGYSNFNLIPRDTKGTASGAAQAADAAIQDGAQLILGPLFGSSVEAVKKVASTNNINVIAFSTDWALADRSTFLMGFLPFSQVDRIASYSASKNIQSVALIAPQDKYGNAVSEHFERAAALNGITITDTIRFAANDNNDAINKIAGLTKGKAPAFKAVFMPVGGSMIETISSALSYNHMMPGDYKRLGTGLWDEPRIATQPNIQGGWFAAPAPSARQTFERKYTETYGREPERLATLAYDATALAAILARRGYERSTQPAYSFNDLTNPNGFSGTDGIFRFKSNGLVERGLAVLEIRGGRIVEIDPAPKRF